LNDSSRPLNAPRSTTRRHRPGGTSRGSCWSWIPGAPAPSSRGGRGRFNPLTPGSAWRSRDAAGTKPKAGGGTTAASAALGRRAAAAAPSTQPHRPAHARRPAPDLLTPPSSATASLPGRPHPSRQRSQPRPRRCPCRPKDEPGTSAASRSHGTDRLVLLQRRCRARHARTPEPRRRSLPLESMSSGVTKAGKHREVQPFRPQGIAGRPSARSTGGSRPRPTSGGPRCDHDSCWPGYPP
jgi:hypothetical protein